MSRLTSEWNEFRKAPYFSLSTGAIFEGMNYEMTNTMTSHIHLYKELVISLFVPHEDGSAWDRKYLGEKYGAFLDSFHPEVFERIKDKIDRTEVSVLFNKRYFKEKNAVHTHTHARVCRRKCIYKEEKDSLEHQIDMFQ